MQFTKFNGLVHELSCKIGQSSEDDGAYEISDYFSDISYFYMYILSLM